MFRVTLQASARMTGPVATTLGVHLRGFGRDQPENDGLVLSRSRRLALGAVLGLALTLLIAPSVLVRWPVLDYSALCLPVWLDQVSRLSDLVQFARLPLFLLLAIRLAGSQRDQ